MRRGCLLGEEWYFIWLIYKKKKHILLHKSIQTFDNMFSGNFVSSHIISRFGFCLMNCCMKVYLAEYYKQWCYVCKASELLLGHCQKHVLLS